MYVTFGPVSSGAAQAWFIAGTVPLILAGGLHALGAVVDAVRPTFFAPIDRAVEPAMQGTGLRFRRMVGGGDRSRPSMWNAWVGFNISHGLGVFVFGLLCLLIAADDFALVERIGVLRPMTVVVSAAYLALSLRFWFSGPAVITGVATACFVVSAVGSS
jgi:hypothetical protein